MHRRRFVLALPAGLAALLLGRETAHAQGGDALLRHLALVQREQLRIQDAMLQEMREQNRIMQRQAEQARILAEYARLQLQRGGMVAPERFIRESVPPSN